ncbi:MAG: hypothetical protein NZ654_14570 [Acidimicrobiales bacterium]|nr:hypothetical protein [Acidimicrobiales bacterium]
MSTADVALEVFDRHGWRAYSEQVSMAEHCTQAAALAQEAGASDAFVLSTLLRRPDFGYRMAMRPGECLVLDNLRVSMGGRGKPTRLAVCRVLSGSGLGVGTLFHLR